MGQDETSTFKFDDEEENNLLENNIDEDEDEDEDEDLAKVDPYAAQKEYRKKNPGTGVKNPTEEKKSQCPICKKYFKRVNEKHLQLVHNMSIAELSEKDPEASKFFTIPGYAIENSDHANYMKTLKQNEAEHKVQEIIEAKKSEGVELIVAEESISKVLDDICLTLGGNRSDKNFVETPKRVAKAYQELLSGMKNTEQQLDDVLKVDFPSAYPGIIVQGNIETVSLCPHHMLPIFNTIYIAYMTENGVVGLSKLARTAEILSKRLIMQEDLTNDIAQALMKRLKPKGVAVIVEANHTCMSIRGAEQTHAMTTTMVVEGVFKYDPQIKKEFLFHVEGLRNQKKR